MSQQELSPEPQEGGEDSSVQPPHPYGWSAKPMQPTPRDEPPSTLEIPMVQRESNESYHNYQSGYLAQNPPPTQQPSSLLPVPVQPSNQQQQQARRSRAFPGEDGDAFEEGYRPWGGYRVPSWARPQRQRHTLLGRILLFLILSALFIPPVLTVIGVLLGTMIGVLVLALVLVPIVLVMLVVFFSVVFLGLRVSGIRFDRRRRRSRMR